MVRKIAIRQQNFALGEVSQNFMIRESQNDDDGIRSVKRLRNMQINNSGSVTTRPGTECLADAPGACGIREVLQDGEIEKAVIPIDGGLIIMAEDGSVEKTVTDLPWTEDQACDLWVKSTGNEVLIGSKDVQPQVLTLDDCEVSPFEFSTGASGSTSQPYYSFHPGVTIQPSNTTGIVTVIASDDVFNAGHVGTIIRYNGQEILVDTYVSPTEITGTFIQDAPPTFDVTVTDGSQYAVDDAVEGLTSSATGVVTSISGNILTILVDDVNTTFSNGEILQGPSTSTTPGAEPTIVGTAVVSPAPSKQWDEQVFSDTRGWPGNAECHTGRLVFTDIPGIPGAVILSEAGNLNGFALGSNDGDAIFEIIEGGRLLYAVSAEDLLLFGVEGVSYLGTRSGDPITPTNFYPRKFTSIGSARVEPALLGDGVAYLSDCGTRLMGATLAGDANRYWQEIHLGEYAPHLIRNPKRLGTTEGDQDNPEKYLYAVNEDGTVAIMRWQRPPFEQAIGWSLWETKGEFVDMTSVFCKNYAIVDRADGRKIERFDPDLCLDCVKFYDSISDIPEPREGLSVYADCRFLGDFDCHDIEAQCFPDDWGPFQVGCAFKQELHLWHRVVASGRSGFVRQRNGRVSISVLDSASYTYNGQRRPSYDAHDDMFAPPPKRTDCHIFTRLGRSHYPCHEIEKVEPGRLTVLAVDVEVQA